MFNLNFRESKPIYEQIKDSFKNMIVSNAMQKDEKLPSVRSLATSLSINPNTIQRAYNELESEGYVYSIPGKGSFVAEVNKENREKINKLVSELLEISKELKFLGIDDDEIFKYIKEGK